MESKVENKEPQEISEEQKKPLLEDQKGPQKKPKTRTQKAIRKTFKGSFRLSSLLPSGSVLIFEMLSPILTNRGECKSFQYHLGTFCLVALVGISCFFMHFIDSVKDERGKIRYGFATFKGIWIMDGSMTLSPEEAAKYRVGFVDFLHAFMGISVFMAVALLDQNVVDCFFPTPSEEIKRLLVRLPIGIGIVCSLLFFCFPSKRNVVVSPPSKK